MTSGPWNPVKELKVDQVICTLTHALWNPVKELKATSPFSSTRIIILYVESGEGIESLCCDDLDRVVRLDQWNPVKELKDFIAGWLIGKIAPQWNPVKELKAVEANDVPPLIGPEVESGEGIES